MFAVGERLPFCTLSPSYIDRAAFFEVVCAGAVGYFDYRGNMDTCIALRTLVVHQGRAYVQAGAGIVADSDPESEYNETLNKARGLLKAIEITEKRVAEE